MAIAAVVLGATAVVLWVMNLGPHGEPKPTVTDWISAVGQALGAIGTAGALWLGAETFRRQVRDQHKAHASAITVGTEILERPLQESKLRCFIVNNSSLPIYRVTLAGCFDQSTKLVDVRVLAPGNFLDFYVSPKGESDVQGAFTDSASNRWIKSDRGMLIENPTSWSGELSQRATLDL